MEWTTALPDWESRIVAGESIIPGQTLFPTEAEAARRIFDDLILVDVLGRPTIGEACRPWVFEFVDRIFGAYNAETGRRLINEFFLLISKKNSKSTIAAGIMLTALLRNWRELAEFYILAPSKEIADNSANPAMAMVRADEELSEILRPVPHQRLIEHRTTGAILKVVAADSEVVGGKKTTGLLIDELWQFGKIASAHNMIREAAGGLASRPEGFVIALSTHSDHEPAGIFRDWLLRYRKIRSGELHMPRCLGALYEFPAGMLRSEAYKDPANFFVTNPNLGASVDMQFLLDKQAEAVETGKQDEIGFYAKHLNVEIGISLGSNRWAGADYWERQADKTLTLAELIRRCDVIVVGVDGGGLDDLLGLAVMGREKTTRRWLLWNKTWVHRSVLELRKSEAPKLLDFEKAGELVIVDDMTAAFADLADTMLEVKESGLLSDKNAIGLDPMGVGLIVEALAERDIRNIEGQPPLIIGISQGWKLNGAIKTAEVKLASGELWHAGQSIVAWAVGNAKVEPKGNAITITKQTAGTAKIDPLMAALNCTALMSMNPGMAPAHQMFFV